ncbi:MAG TPA: ABC transporter permease subunit [Vicinamibacteria bacterium]|nr:ABC transporter permease subunit [Vicinamibacteria bacterium]
MNRTQPTRGHANGSSSATWWLVFRRELTELWVGGKALILIVLFSVLLGVMSFVLASNHELNLIPPPEMVYLTLQTAIVVGVFIGLIIGADSISGERERATLEALLLTPTSRTQILVGKFLAAISPWPAAYLITYPFLSVLSQGHPVLAPAMFWGAILGTFLTLAFTAFGMLVSTWSSSLKGSMFVSLTVYVLFLLPTQFPGAAQTGLMGRALKLVNPLESVNHFLEKVLVNNRGMDEVGYYLSAPTLFFVLSLGMLFFYASPRLCLEPAHSGRFRLPWSRVASLFLIGCLSGSLSARPAIAQEEPSEEEQAEDEAAPAEEDPEAVTDMAPAHDFVVPDLPLRVSIDVGYRQMKTGEMINFKTSVTNDSPDEESPAMIVAMNIINIDGEGDPVDPEDWSPQRAQYVEPLEPGETAIQDWTVHAVWEGEFMTYMVVIPEPEGPDSTTQPLTTSGIHMTVASGQSLNPGGVLPFAIAIPVALLVATLVIFRLRRKAVDAGAA